MYKRLFVISCLIAAGFYSCGSHKTDKQNKTEKTGKTDTVKSIASDTVKTKASEKKVKENDCDSTLWLHVYNPSRLKIYQSCITATGTITKIKEEDDGDRHMLLDLDPGQEKLLNESNKIDKKGYLVIEVVCANKVHDKKAKSACEGFSNKIQIPNVGDHVRITGSHVLDTHNGWMEIHPVSSIEVIK